MKEDDMRHRQDLERKRLPKIQRNELRTKAQAKRKLLRNERNKRESIVVSLNAFEKEKLREVFWCLYGICKCGTMFHIV